MYERNSDGFERTDAAWEGTMPLWIVTMSTHRKGRDGAVVRGTQSWVVASWRIDEARDQALAVAINSEAERHRRGAAIDLVSLTVEAYVHSL